MMDDLSRFNVIGWYGEFGYHIENPGVTADYCPECDATYEEWDDE